MRASMNMGHYFHDSSIAVAPRRLAYFITSFSASWRGLHVSVSFTMILAIGFYDIMRAYAEYRY